MSTRLDLEFVAQYLTRLSDLDNSLINNKWTGHNSIETILHIGILNNEHDRMVRAIFPDANYITLDKNPNLKPNIVHDLDSHVVIPEEFDLVVCCNVLMYTQYPQWALEKILECSRYAIVQEPVIRNRGAERDIDLNRFYSKNMSLDFNSTIKHGYNLINIKNATGGETYVNGEGAIGGIWSYGF